jgi:hypothetical protein
MFGERALVDCIEKVDGNFLVGILGILPAQYQAISGQHISNYIVT